MMRTRHAVFLLALMGGAGAAVLAVATHRHMAGAELAQRLGGQDARSAAQAALRFGQVQELGFLALAVVFLALFLLLLSLPREAGVPRTAASRLAEAPVSLKNPESVSAQAIALDAPVAPAPVAAAPPSTVQPSEESAPHV